MPPTKPCTIRHLKAGDRIIADGWAGVVAFNSATDSYDAAFPRSDWPTKEYAGLMVRHAGGALVLYPAGPVSGEDAPSLSWQEPLDDPG